MRILGEMRVALDASRVARWDGQQWSAVDGGTDGTVSAMALFDDGNGPAIHVGGTFTTAGGVPVGGLAKWYGVS